MRHARPDRARRAGLTDREGFLAWAFVLPSVVYIVALVALPLGLAIALAFSDVTAGDPSYDPAGLRNLRAVLGDPVFWRSLGNTLLCTTVGTALTVVLGTILASVLIADLRGRRLVRFLVLLPWTTPVALSAVSWRWLLDPVHSPVDWALRSAGILQGAGNWLGRPALAMASVVGVHVWRLVPLATIIMMAGLAAIPRDVREAAHVDGAGFWRRTFGVTIPLMLPMIALAALFPAGAALGDLAVVYVMTGGGPADSTQVLSSLAHARAFGRGDLGQGAVVALFLVPLLLATMIGVLRVVRGLAAR